MKRELSRILHVEDEPDIQAVAKLALEAVGGFTVRICSGGHEALEAVGEFKPDLILLDVMMPGMDGPSTLRKLRELPETAKTPVVFMTAKTQAREVDDLLAMGAQSVIPKPFNPMTLAAELRAIWERVA